MGCQIPAFKVIRRGSLDFMGFKRYDANPLFGGHASAMLFSVHHYLGVSWESVREAPTLQPYF